MSGLLGSSKFVSGIPILGNALNSMGIVGNPDEDAVQKSLADMKKAYSAYRPQAQQQSMLGLGNQLSAFGGTNDMLASMYGPQAKIDTSKLLQNPMAGNAAGGTPFQTAMAKQTARATWAQANPELAKSREKYLPPELQYTNSERLALQGNNGDPLTNEQMMARSGS